MNVVKLFEVFPLVDCRRRWYKDEWCYRAVWVRMYVHPVESRRLCRFRWRRGTHSSICLFPSTLCTEIVQEERSERLGARCMRECTSLKKQQIGAVTTPIHKPQVYQGIVLGG